MHTLRHENAVLVHEHPAAVVLQTLGQHGRARSHDPGQDLIG